MPNTKKPVLEAHNKLSHRRWEIRDVKVADLAIDPHVQQPLREGKVNGMLTRGFDIGLVGTITVSAREHNPPSIIIDGQTRWTAARRCGVETLPAIIWYDLTPEEEAWLFIDLNKKSNPPTLATFLVEVTKGDPTAVAMTEILRDHGWKVASASQDGTFAAVAMGRRIYEAKPEFRSEMIGPALFQDTIAVITAAWGLDRTGMDAYMLGGVAAVLARYSSEINKKRLIEVLNHLTPARLRAEGKATQKTLSTTPVNAFGWHILHEYNRGLRSKQLQPFLL